MGIKTDHITFKGSSLVRNSNDIYPETVDHFKEFQISKNGVYMVTINKTPFQAKVTIANEGAIFDIMKGKDVAFTNICCFNKKNKDDIINLVESMASKLDKTQIIRTPSEDLFIYSFAVNPFIVSPDEGSLAGEIEFYIYYSLYIANHDK